MVAEKVQAEGQIAIPADVRAAADIAPGDTVVFSVEGPGNVRLTTLHPMSLWGFIEKFELRDPIPDWQAFREAAEEEQAEELFRRIRAGEE